MMIPSHYKHRSKVALPKAEGKAHGLSILLKMTVLQSYCILVSLVYAATASSSSFNNLLCENKLESDSSNILSGEQTIGPGQLCLVKNKWNITIEGTNDNTLVNCTGPRSFGFVNMTNFNLRQFQFRHCGGRLTSEAVENDNSSSEKYFFFSQGQKVVLYFSNCFNVAIEGISFEGRYQGFAIVLANVFQKIELISITIDGSMQNCNINDDIITSSTACEGNGIVIYQHNKDLDQQSPHSLSSDIELIDISVVATKSTYFQDKTLCLNMLLGSNSSPIQSAAGITMIFTQNQFHTNISISDSIITDTFGQIGSGILATFIDTQNFSTIELSNITLINNDLEIESECSGNSLQIIIHYFDSSKTTQEKWTPVIVSNSTISNQTANAAVFISVTEQSPVVVHISFENVSFHDCKGNDRGVCMLAEALYGEADENTFLQVVLKSVTVQRNMINYLPIMSNPRYLNGTSRLYTSGLLTFINVDVVTLLGDLTNPSVFSDNIGSVFTGIATDFQLEGNLIFENNQAISGIAFLLFSFSHMFLKPGLSTLFINNRNSRDYGSIIKLKGASYDNTMCVFQVMATNTTSSINTTNINVTFFSNDTQSGKNIVPIDATSLYNCRQAALPVEPNCLSELYDNIFHFYGYKHYMQSTPKHIQFCSKNDSTQLDDSKVNITTYPGAEFRLHIVVKDARDSRVPSNLFILHSHENPPSWTLGHKYNIDYNQLHDRCQKNDFILKGDPGNGSFFISLPDTRPTLTFNIKLLECPDGFSFSSNNQTCECSNFIKFIANKTGNQIKCNLEGSPHINIPYGAWIGHIDVNGSSDRVLAYASICPRDLCTYTSKNSYYPQADDNCNLHHPDDIRCTKGRTGRYCSDCKTNHSVIFGSNECRACSNLWVFTYPGFVLVAFVMILCMYLLRLTLDNGAIGGIILYANFAQVAIRFHKFYSPGSSAFAALFISVINLSSGLPLCFYNGMTDEVKTLLSFVFPIFVLLLVIGIVLVSRHSTKFSKLAKRSPQVLITVIHITFAKSLITTINALSIGEAYIEEKNGTSKRIYIWFLNGREEYGTGLHILLLIAAAISILLFLLPYFILVVFGTCLLRFKTIDKLRPFYDTIYAPYKDRFRWWFGVRQIILVVAYSVFAATAGMHIGDLLVISFCLVAIFALVQAWINPFKSAMINFIDTSYIVNLSVLVFIGIYYAAKQDKPPAWLLDLVFGAVPFTFFTTVIAHLLVSLGIYNKLKGFFMQLQQYLSCSWFKNVRNTSDQAGLQYRAQYDEIPDENYNENNCELRESLLDM